MSDYIRREDVLGIIRSGWSNHYSCKDMCDEIKELPTLDEKEIIRKAFERVLTRLEEYWRTHKAWEDYEMFNGTYIEMLQHEKVVKAYEKAIKIVKEECGINE